MYGPNVSERQIMFAFACMVLGLLTLVAGTTFAVVKVVGYMLKGAGLL